MDKLEFNFVLPIRSAQQLVLDEYKSKFEPDIDNMLYASAYTLVLGEHTSSDLSPRFDSGGQFTGLELYKITVQEESSRKFMQSNTNL